MTRRAGFARSLLVALLIACLYPVYRALTAALLGPSLADATSMCLAAAAYALAIAPQPARGVPAAAALLVAGATALSMGAGVTTLAVVLAATLAWVRSGLLHVTRAGGGFARSSVAELVLIGGGLGFASCLLDRTPEGMALALWAFLLVQSGFFLLGGPASPRDTADGPGGARVAPDPFEAACARARALLEPR